MYEEAALAILYDDATSGDAHFRQSQPSPALSPYETVGIEPTPPDTHDTIEGVTGSKDKDKKDEKVPLNSKPQYDEVTLGAQDIKRPQSPPSLSPYETVGTGPVPLDTYDTKEGVTGSKDKDMKDEKVAINSKPHYNDVTLGAQDIKRPESPPDLSPYETVGIEPIPLDTDDTIEGVTGSKDNGIKGEKVAIKSKPHYNDVTLGAQDIKMPKSPPALSPYETVGIEPIPLDTFDTIEGVTGSKDNGIKGEKIAINSKPQYDEVTLGAQNIKMPKSPQGLSPYETVGVHPPDTYDTVDGATGEKDEEVKEKTGSNLSPSVQGRASLIYAQVQKKKSYIYAQVNKRQK